MVSFKAIANAGIHTPERMIGYEHKSLYDIADTDLYIKDFELFTSSNTEKYNNDNAEAVIIHVKLLSGEEYTTVTHAKNIVRTFKNIKERNLSWDSDGEVVQFHKGTTTKNGQEVPQWQII